MSNQSGVLYVVATPIGNLADLSARAIDVLGAVAVIAAEDTRHTRRLLDHCGVQTSTISLHEHNERTRSAALVARLLDGDSVALVSDAGTPLISDPGFRLVRAAHDAGVAVRAVPGPCAAIAALSIAGLPTDRFVFEGFLAARGAARQAQLGQLRDESRTMIFYLSPKRLAMELQAAAEVFGVDRPAALGRELTKAFESFYHGTLGDLLEQCHADANMQKGELVLLVTGVAPVAEATDHDRLLGALLDAVPLKTAVDIAARATGVPRNSLYRRALQLKGENSPKNKD